MNVSAKHEVTLPMRRTMGCSSCRLSQAIWFSWRDQSRPLEDRHLNLVRICHSRL